MQLQRDLQSAIALANRLQAENEKLRHLLMLSRMVVAEVAREAGEKQLTAGPAAGHNPAVVMALQAQQQQQQQASPLPPLQQQPYATAAPFPPQVPLIRSCSGTDSGCAPSARVSGPTASGACDQEPGTPQVSQSQGQAAHHSPTAAAAMDRGAATGGGAVYTGLLQQQGMGMFPAGGAIPNGILRHESGISSTTTTTYDPPRAGYQHGPIARQSSFYSHADRVSQHGTLVAPTWALPSSTPAIAPPAGQESAGAAVMQHMAHGGASTNGSANCAYGTGASAQAAAAPATAPQLRKRSFDGDAAKTHSSEDGRRCVKQQRLSPSPPDAAATPGHGAADAAAALAGGVEGGTLVVPEAWEGLGPMPSLSELPSLGGLPSLGLLTDGVVAEVAAAQERADAQEQQRSRAAAATADAATTQAPVAAVSIKQEGASEEEDEQAGTRLIIGSSNDTLASLLDAWTNEDSMPENSSLEGLCSPTDAIAASGAAAAAAATAAAGSPDNAPQPVPTPTPTPVPAASQPLPADAQRDAQRAGRSWGEQPAGGGAQSAPVRTMFPQAAAQVGGSFPSGAERGVEASTACPFKVPVPSAAATAILATTSRGMAAGAGYPATALGSSRQAAAQSDAGASRQGAAAAAGTWASGGGSGVFDDLDILICDCLEGNGDAASFQQRLDASWRLQQQAAARQQQAAAAAGAPGSGAGASVVHALLAGHMLPRAAQQLIAQHHQQQQVAVVQQAGWQAS